MINEHTEETASLYVLGLLDPGQARRFEAELRANVELARLVRELEESAAALAHGIPAQAPPPDLKARILNQAREKRVVPFARRAAWLPWALAACLAIIASVLALDGLRLQKELAYWREQDVFSRMKIATLNSMLDSAPQGRAVVVWDKEKQQGVLKVENMPQPRADQDYQLWVIDPSHKLPVNAGVLHFETDGIAKASFKPNQPVASADKFAISLERKGGAPQHEGPIVMISQ